MDMPWKARWVSGEKLFLVLASTEMGMVQMQKSAVWVWLAPDLVQAMVTPVSLVVISVTGESYWIISGGRGASEAVADAVHAADGLEHGGLPVDLVLVELALAEVGGEQLGELERLVEDLFDRSGAGRCGEAAAGGAGVLSGVIEVAEAGEEVAEAGEVLLREDVVERMFVDGFGEQLGEVAAGIVEHPALGNGHAAVQQRRLHQGPSGRC